MIGDWAVTASIQFLIVGTLCVAWILSRRIHAAALSPLTILAVFWLVPPETTFLRPEWNLSPETWLIVIASYYTFIAGYLAVVGLTVRHPINLNFRREARWAMWGRKRFAFIIKVLWFLGMVGFVIGLSNILRSGGIQYYVEAGFREAELVFGANTLVNYLYFLNGLVLVLSTVYILHYGFSWSVSFYLAISFVTLPFLGIRSTVLHPLVLTFWTVTFLRRRVPWKLALGFIVIGILVFQAVTIGRELPILLKGAHDPLYFLTYRIENILGYIAPNYANLNAQMTLQQTYTYGASSLQFIPTLISFFMGDRKTFEQEMFLVDPAFNFGTYLREFYADFGLVGIYGGTFLIGWVSATFFVRYLCNRTTANLVAMSIIATDLTWSFQTNQFMRIQFLYYLAVVYGLQFCLFPRWFNAAVGERFHSAYKLLR